VLAGLWFAASENAIESVPKSLTLILQQAFAVDAQPVADWLYGAYNCSPEHPDWTEDDDLPDRQILGDSLLKLPLNPLWIEWRRLDGSEMGTLLLENHAKHPHHVALVVFLKQKGSDRAELLGDGYMRTDKDFNPEGSEVPGECGWTFNEIVEATVTFFHCKNVRIVARERSPQAVKTLHRKYSISVPTFHVIEIHLSHTRSAGSDRQNKNPQKFVVAQIVRGHFKRFQGDSKLFGKRNGIWFWNMLVRGEGVPLKSEYRTWPPDAKHKRKCKLRLKEPPRAEGEIIIN
jgi:hypothetical protein